MDFDAQLSALKRALRVETDMALAECLGLQRFAVSKWRKRESIPDKYLALIPKTGDDISNALDTALRITLFHNPGNSYTLAAATAVMHDGYLRDLRADTPQKAVALERLMLRIASVAMNAVNLDLQKVSCDTQDDYLQLVHLLRTKYADQVASVIAKFALAFGMSPH